ncbi:MAG: peptide deformylase [Candidatus Cloacimonadota bacterium]|nr:MAG: peptide deformylase [Candidatus Cloacimonadota bacterium]
MEIYKFGAECLRENTNAVKNITQELLNFMDDMIETMILAPGVGLAGPQVGLNKDIFTINADEGIFEKIINPRVLKKEGISTFNEGCLSFPLLYSDVVRPEWIKVSYLNEDGEEVIKEGDGLWARCFQHELDHLSGVLFIDHLSKKQMKELKKDLKDIKKIGLSQNDLEKILLS